MNSKEIEQTVKDICENRFAIDFETSKEDAQLIADVIKVISNNGFSISYAQAILSDAQKILPLIVEL